MKILAVGDLVGENGVKKLKDNLKNIVEAEKIDFIIVNAENSAGGMGISTKIYNELCQMNVDVITMGNHTWGKKDIFSFIDNKNIIRPANYSRGVPGKGYTIIEKDGKKICVINAIGRTDMGILSENPFTTIDDILKEVDADIIILDFHAEATAEKIAMGYYFDGRVTAIFGTHTHVQTADETILPNGTGYITDIGMTGPKDGVIGMNKEASLKRFITSLPERYRLADGECKLNAVVIDIDDEKNRTKKIYRIKC